MLKFKKMKEIKIIETKKVETRKEEGFKQIKPETGMTMTEAMCFWNEIFSHGGV